MHLETKGCPGRGVWILGSCRNNQEVGLTHCKENIYYLVVTNGNAALWRRGLVIPESGIKHSGSQICGSSHPGSWRKFRCFGPTSKVPGSVGVEWSPRSLSLTSAQGVCLTILVRDHSLRTTTSMFVSNQCPGRTLDHIGQGPFFEGHYSSASWKNPSVTIHRGLLKPNGHWTLQPSKPSAARTHGRSWAGQTAQMPAIPLRRHPKQTTFLRFSC